MPRSETLPCLLSVLWHNWRSPVGELSIDWRAPGRLESLQHQTGLHMTNKPKGIRIDGKKLRDLRTKEGKTQKGVIAGSAVQLRTYQRAEHGQLILPDLAEQIARRFKVDLKAIRVDK